MEWPYRETGFAPIRGWGDVREFELLPLDEAEARVVFSRRR